MPAAKLGSRLRKLATAFDPGSAKRVLAAGAEVGVKAIPPAARDDLGSDGAMSGWRRGHPIVLGAAFSFSHDGKAVTIHRDKASAGPMRVATIGRNQGGAAGFHGPGINRRSGVTSRNKSGALRKVRTVRRRRANGQTEGKGTWDDARDAAKAGITRAMWKQQQAEVRRAVGR